MKKLFCLLFISALTCACSGPKDTALPTSLDKMDSIKSAMDKLPAEEKVLVTGYIMRHTVGATLGAIMGRKPDAGIPEGMTVGKAIDEQRGFLAEAAAEEAKQKALKEKLQAEREAAMQAMRGAVTVTLVSKKLAEDRGLSGMMLDEKLEIVVGYKNNTDKVISGVKGTLRVTDLFDDNLSNISISNDTTIPPGKSVTWAGSRSLRFAIGGNQDRKFASLTDDKYKTKWEPDAIVFADGTSMKAASDK